MCLVLQCMYVCVCVCVCVRSCARLIAGEDSDEIEEQEVPRQPTQAWQGAGAVYMCVFVCVCVCGVCVCSI